MKISGALEDAGVAEVMQLVHFGGRSGTLRVTSGHHRAEVEFHRGHVVRAWATHLPRLGDLLVREGHLGREQLEAAARQQAATPQRPFGQVLIESRLLPPATLRQAIEEQIQRVVFEIVGWKQGGFDFALGDENLADGGTADHNAVLPGLELDTQKLLLEAVRRLDESTRRRAAAASASDVDDAFDSIEGTLSGVDEPPAASPAAVHLVSPDAALVAALGARLAEHDVPARAVPLRDAGVPLPGGTAPVVLLDLRGGAGNEELASLVRLHPGLSVVALVDAAHGAVGAFDAGARAVVHPRHVVVVACLRRLAELPAVAAVGDGGTAEPVVGRLRRILGDIRSGLFSATLALNLMNVVADAAERAILFLVRTDALQVLGAFGFARDPERPLIERVRHLRLERGDAGVFEEPLRSGQVHEVDWRSDDLPAVFRQQVGAPVSGSALLIPVLGRERSIALIYVDNGPLWAPLRDAGVLELATAQVGFAFENQLLRNLLDRTDPTPATATHPGGHRP